ncbi:hypothetical protein RSAG8_12006, partial [Rhizoctonia solani AG-8 WAC10335]
MVSVYFASLVISSILPSIKLKNDSNLLSMCNNRPFFIVTGTGVGVYARC